MKDIIIVCAGTYGREALDIIFAFEYQFGKVVNAMLKKILITIGIALVLTGCGQEDAPKEDLSLVAEPVSEPANEPLPTELTDEQALSAIKK